MHDSTLDQVFAWTNLLLAHQRAAKGKRGKPSVAAFELDLADRLIDLQEALRSRSYRPGAYRHFFVHESKRRKISAAPFRDRVIHHALVQVIEPIFERRFIPHSYANRIGRGTHRALDQAARFARQYTFVLRIDIVRHFASIDHAILQAYLERFIRDDGLRWLIATIIASGRGVLEEECPPTWFAGDDLWAPLRPKGLPIGNLTSQFWSNCVLDPVDQFVWRSLRHRAYLRYVDDLLVFSDSKRALWAAKRAITERLSALRLRMHEREAQVMTTRAGVPWLGFIIGPERRRPKARKVRHFTRLFRRRWEDYEAGRISFGALDASVRGWLEHLRRADTQGLVRHLLDVWPPELDPEGEVIAPPVVRADSPRGRRS